MYTPDITTWMNPNIEYLFNEEIIEYDMRDAGFSLIKQFKLLDSEEIDRLNKLQKDPRKIAIGLLQRHGKLSSVALTSKFAEMRSVFITENSLTDNDIITVKKDAIFTIGKCKNQKFGGIEFAEKNHYSSYIRFVNNSNIEIFYNDDSGANLEIKGIGDVGINRHRLYLIPFICKIIKHIELRNPSAKHQIKSFIDDYKSMKLDEGYYIEFNNMSSSVDAMFNYQKLIIPLVQIIQGEFDK
jgi:hypothetical protein